MRRQPIMWTLGVAFVLLYLALLSWGTFFRDEGIKGLLGGLIIAGVVTLTFAILNWSLDAPGTSDQFRAKLATLVGLGAVVIGGAGVLVA